MIKFEFVERIKTVAMESSEGAFCQLPERATESSAGYDFYNPEEVIINPKEIKYVKTGIKAAMPNDTVLVLANRSSNPKKKNLILINGVGIVDADYYNNSDNEGEIAFAFYNISNEPVTLKQGEKLGQGIFMTYFLANNDRVKGNERTGGFGSTGE